MKNKINVLSFSAATTISQICRFYITNSSFARFASAFPNYSIFHRLSRSFQDVKWPVSQLCGRRKHMMFNFVFLPVNCLFKFCSRMVRIHFSSIMTWNNWGMIAETRSYIFRWLGSLSNHDDDGNKNPTNLHIWQWKIVFLHALHVHFSSFDILKMFSFFLRREMTIFAVVWRTWAYDDKC